MSDEVPRGRPAEVSFLEREIEEQPQTLARLLREGRSQVERAAEQIRRFDPHWVVIAARGTSDNAARYAQYLFGAQNGLGVGLAAPSLFTLYGSPPRLDRALTIGVSQSGQSPDVVAVVEEARRQGGATLSFTNDADSPLARAAESSLAIAAGPERSVAATKTYTSQLLALAMLSTALGASEDRWRELAGVPEAVAEALSSSRRGADAERLAGAPGFVVIGRGYNYATAFEIALKIKETSYVLAEPYSGADLLHGPMAMVDHRVPVLVVAPSGRGADAMPELLGQLARRGAPIAMLSDRADLLERAAIRLPLPSGVPEWVSPIVAVVPGQLFAKSLAEARGVDPDRPRGLAKVTRTR